MSWKIATPLLDLTSGPAPSIVGGEHVSDASSYLEIGPEFSISSIFLFCAVLYGGLGALWLVFKQLPKESQEGSVQHTGLLCITFGSMSLGMHLLNKSLVTALAAPCLITGIQMLASAVAIIIMQWDKIKETEHKQALVWMIVPGLFASMLISSFYTYSLMNLSFFTIVRNLAPMVCLPVEYMTMPAGEKPQVTLPIVTSLVIMLVGAAVFGYDTVSFSLLGILAAVLNMLFGVADRVVQRRLLVSECKGIPVESCTFLNNSVGLLPAVLAAFMTGEVASIPSNTQVLASWQDPQMLALMVLSCAIGLGISYFGLACQKAVSATSVMVIQNIVKVGVVMVGVGFFGDNLTSPMAITGILLSLGGSLYYSKIQLDMKSAAVKKDGEGIPFGKKDVKAAV